MLIFDLESILYVILLVQLADLKYSSIFVP